MRSRQASPSATAWSSFRCQYRAAEPAAQDRVDTDAWSREDAQRLREKVGEAGIFDLPGELTSSGRQKDRFSYALTLEDAERQHTVLASEEALPARVRSLVSWLGTVPEREDRIERVGECPVPG